MSAPKHRSCSLAFAAVFAAIIPSTETAFAQTASCEANYIVGSQWPGGFTAEVVINNSGPAIDGWTLSWSFPDGQQISQAWNASVNAVGPQASVSNAAWNGAIARGGQVSFGFNGQWSGRNDPPITFTLNDIVCGASDPGPPPGPTPDTLRDAATGQLQIGTAVSDAAFRNEANYREALNDEFSSLTAENVMKPSFVQPQRGQFNFERGDALVRFAQDNDQVVRGHTLLWHNQNPAWLTNGNFSDAELLGILRDHVTVVVTHYRGQIYEWDVANEVIDDNANLRSTSPWFQLGEAYIGEAFRAARAADPNARLFLNDYSIDGINNKSDAYYDLVQRLLDQGVPIDGIGFQAHLINGQYPASMQANLQRFKNIGLDVAVTELDVRIQLPATANKLQTQADTYRQVLQACLAVGCSSFTVWGFTDRHSWIPSFFPGFGAATLLNEQLDRKTAYESVLQTLQSN